MAESRCSADASGSSNKKAANRRAHAIFPRDFDDDLRELATWRFLFDLFVPVALQSLVTCPLYDPLSEK